MTCRELTEFLDAYLNGELTPAERAEFDRHLAVCDHCIAYLDGYKRTVDLCRALGRPTTGAGGAADAKLPADVPEDLVRAILASRKP